MIIAATLEKLHPSLAVGTKPGIHGNHASAQALLQGECGWELTNVSKIEKTPAKQEHLGQA